MNNPAQNSQRGILLKDLKTGAEDFSFAMRKKGLLPRKTRTRSRTPEKDAALLKAAILWGGMYGVAVGSDGRYYLQLTMRDADTACERGEASGV